MTRKTVPMSEITTELIENASREFDNTVSKQVERIKTQYPNLIFQEKHTRGFLWWKHERYQYYRYQEGSMTGIPTYSVATINKLETK